jgi:hypothetical protein
MWDGCAAVAIQVEEWDGVPWAAADAVAVGDRARALSKGLAALPKVCRAFGAYK